MTLVLFAALIKIYDGYITPLGATSVRCWKSKVNPDGIDNEISFLVGLYRIQLDRTELEITMGFDMKNWDKFKCMELPRARHWSTSQSDVIERLGKL